MVQHKLIAFYKDETAAAAIEYIMFFSFISMVVIPSILEYRDWLIGLLDHVNDTLGNIRI